MAFTQNGSGFTNLSKIVNANKDNQLGSTIQSGITGAVQNTQNNLNQAQQSFNTDVNNNRVDTDANKQLEQNVLQDPTKATAGDVSSFAKFRSGSYTGPTDINNIGAIQGQAQDAQSLGQNTTTSGGRQALLQRFAGGNQYTQGQQGLDNILLGQTGGQNLQASQRATQGLVGQVGKTDANAQATAAMAQTGAQQFAKDTLSNIQKVYDPVSQQIDQNLGTLQGNENTRNTQAQSILDLLNQQGITAQDVANNNFTSGSKTDMELAQQALSQAAQQGLLSGADLSTLQGYLPQVQSSNQDFKNLLSQSFYNNAATNLTRAGAASQQQANTVDALDALSGKQNEFGAIGGVGAGSAGFDLDKFRNALGVAPAAGTGGGDDGSTKHTSNPLWDISLVGGAPVLVPSAAATAAGLDAVKTSADATQQLMHGDVRRSAVTAAGGPSSAVNAGAQGLNNGIGAVGNALGDLGFQPGQQITGDVQGLTTQPLANTTNTLNNAQSNALDQLSRGDITGSAATLTQAPGQVATGITSAINNSSDQIGDQLNGTVNGLGNAYNVGQAPVNTALNAGANTLATYGDQNAQALQNFGKGNIQDAATQAALAQFQAAGAGIDTVRQGANNALNQLDQFGQNIFSGGASAAQSIADAASHAAQQVSNIGGGKVICTELHRQGYLTDEVIALDAAYGAKFRKDSPDAYLGYIIAATPVVQAMKQSKVITKLVSLLAIPWSKFMANKMDANQPASRTGEIINNIGVAILPYVYIISEVKEKFEKCEQ